MRRDRRTLAMMVVLPLLLLVVFGYAASFDVAPGEGRAEAVRARRDGVVPVAVLAGPGGATVLLDGSELFTANAARTTLARQDAAVAVEVTRSTRARYAAHGDAGPPRRPRAAPRSDLVQNRRSRPLRACS